MKRCVLRIEIKKKLERKVEEKALRWFGNVERMDELLIWTDSF